MRPSISLQGLDETIKSLKNLGEASQNRITRNAARAGATVARKELIKAAPRGKQQSKASRTYGQLHKNIKMSQHKAGGKFLPYYRVTTGRAFWGGFLDKGTKHISPSFWWQQTIELIRSAVQSGMIDNIRKSILREVNRK